MMTMHEYLSTLPPDQAAAWNDRHRPSPDLPLAVELAQVIDVHAWESQCDERCRHCREWRDDSIREAEDMIRNIRAKAAKQCATSFMD
jgi:hypothetical protein